MIRVVLADDQSLVRAGFRVLLETAGDVEIVGEAATGEQAVALAATARPDIVLMDIRMPIMDGLEATRRIASDPQLTGVRVLVLTTFETDEYVFQALRAGASGFVVKDILPAELLTAVRVVADGEALLSPRVTKRLIAEFTARVPQAEDRASRQRLDSLTDREVTVLELVATGLSNKEIADSLVVSEATVKTHVSRILTKLAARDRAQLVVIAYETGVVRPGHH
ncbi:MAG: response regulator transcription factor [Chloroflexi bacterium]|nr:response regulator transcription factor [Chloroflexota bacterium]